MSNENNNQFNEPQIDNQPQGNYYNQPVVNNLPQEKKASVGLAILSYLIPIVGLILYLTKKDDKPKTAKVCGKCALASFIINIALVIIMYAIMGAAIFGAAGGDDIADIEDNTVYSQSSEIEADNKNDDTVLEGDVIGDYKCVVKSAEICKDYSGKDAVLITYEFTNNSKDATSFDVALSAKPYQDGVGLETAILLDEDTDLLDVEIKSGVTKEVKKAYVLRDTSTELEVEISELFSLNDNKLVTKVKI
ncbi:MAG: DUF5067 domain-containing protein [Acetobacter sp.]|nr:DUF5067 domain-containing protein [Bacteroides sp.]MCM1342133.1 DUF5067 domain-containing protein [Acetobacter sp.]MCM1434352.1 DUF5067 domain-containing protein [Clostridiales bacterium]